MTIGSRLAESVIARRRSRFWQSTALAIDLSDLDAAVTSALSLASAGSIMFNVVWRVLATVARRPGDGRC
jgi:hypothetical protein